MKKIIISFICATFCLSIGLMPNVTKASTTENQKAAQIDKVLDFSGLEKELVELGNYYTYDENGNPTIDFSNPEVYNLGFTQEQLNELNNLVSNITEEGEEPSKIQARGFVGIKVSIGKKTRGLGAIAGGAFAAGYIGWHVKRIAMAGPWGAGAAAAITATCSATVGYAIKKGLKTASVGVHIPYASLSYTVKTP